MLGRIKERCHYAPYIEKICHPDDVIPFFKNGMSVGWSGFSAVGDPKVVPAALADYVEKNNLQGKLQFDLYIGASSGVKSEDRWAKNFMTKRRYPYQNGPHIKQNLNSGKLLYADKHLSEFPLDLYWGFYTKDKSNSLDISVIEATEILDDGSLILSASVGPVPEIVAVSDKIIIELNTSLPSFKGVHDIVTPWNPPGKPLSIIHTNDRIGSISVKIDPKKVVAIVESQLNFAGRPYTSPDESSKRIASNIIDFFENEVRHNRLPQNLLPLQSGTGNIANAVLEGLNDSKFGGLHVFTEVTQEAMLHMFDSGKLDFASSTCMALQDWSHFYGNFEKYKKNFVLRQQSVSNSPELIRRLGVIAMNTPVEVDIYGQANSSHLCGTKMVNGIGGSGDYLRNGYITILHCPSKRKTKNDINGISSIVPMCSHVDHTEHDIDVVVTDQGLADLRGLAPIQRAELLIEKCCHPSYKDQLTDYLNMAKKECFEIGAGHEPQILSKAFKMHTNLIKNGTMHLDKW